MSRARRLLARNGPILALVALATAGSLGGLYGIGAFTHPVYTASIDDNLYYLARIANVGHGYPGIGNPFYFEHRFDAAPAFTLPDQVAALPLLAHASLPLALAFDFLTCSIVFLLLCYALLRRVPLDRWLAVAGSALLYAEVYGWLLHPVFKYIYLVFVAFVLAIALVERTPRFRSFGPPLVAALAALSFYTYGYLWQIVGATLLALIVLHLLRREWRHAGIYLAAGAAGLIGGLPEIAQLMHQFADPIYRETMARIGLVATHWPTLEQYYYGRWLLLAMLGWYLLRRRLLASAIEDALVYGLGTGLALANWSNLISGQEMELGEHVGRFIMWYVMLAVILFALHARTLARERGRWLAKAAVAVLFLALVASAASNLRHSGPWDLIRGHAKVTNEAQLRGVLEWLAAKPPSVVLADDFLALYIPIYTPSFDLYSPSGRLQMVSDSEVLDRYLTAHAIGPVPTPAALAADVNAFTGMTLTKPLQKQSLQAAWCKRYRLDIFFGMWCTPPADLQTADGAAYWDTLIASWRTHRAQLPAKLAEYGVRYIALPNERRADVAMLRLPLEVAYQDAYYTVYALTTR